MTEREARRQALDDAYARAIAEVAGVNLQSESMESKSESLGSGERESMFVESFAVLTRSTSHGKLVNKKILVDSIEILQVKGVAPIRRLHVKVQADVVLEEGRTDPSFQLSISLNRKVFSPADEVIATIESSQDCYLTLFGFSDDSVRVLFPNEYMKDNSLNSGRSFEYPPKGFRSAGVHLRPALPPGESRATEAIVAVATRAAVPFQGWQKRGGSENEVETYRAATAEFNRWLAQIPLNARAEAHGIYEIVGK